MCDGQHRPSGVAGALAMLDRALDHLAAMDAASLPTSAQAEILRALERAGAKHTASRSRVLAAFTAQAGYEDDGHRSARTWLKWQARITAGAAAGAVGWARRLAAHPAIADALAAGDLSESWAREMCGWTDRLPEAQQGDADQILAAAARAGADLAGLAGLAREMYERCHRDGSGDGADDGFADRSLWLGLTFGGAGRLTGDLAPGCSAALSAVLEVLGKRAGPEDLRTAMQRRHDALEEACRRLIRSGMLPGRGGQPTQVLVHMTLAELRGDRGAAAGTPGSAAGGPGASAAEDAWAAARASQPGWLTGPEAEAAACDATMVPVVTGHVDQAALDRFVDIFLAITTRPAAGPGPASPPAGAGRGASGRLRHRQRSSRPGHHRRGLPGHRRPRAAPPRYPGPAAAGAARPGRRRPLRPRRPARTAPRRARRHPADHGQSAAGHRRRDRDHPRPPAPRRHHPPPPLRVPRLRPARQRLRHPPPDPPGPRRAHRPAQPRPALRVPPPDRRPPVGLGTAPQPRRHHHRHQPRPHPHPAQPRPATQPGRIAGEKAA